LATYNNNGKRIKNIEKHKKKKRVEKKKKKSEGKGG